MIFCDINSYNISVLGGKCSKCINLVLKWQKKILKECWFDVGLGEPWTHQFYKYKQKSNYRKNIQSINQIKPNRKRTTSEPLCPLGVHLWSAWTDPKRTRTVLEPTPGWPRTDPGLTQIGPPGWPRTDQEQTQRAESDFRSRLYISLKN